MKTLLATAATLLMLGAAPALAMSCCGGGKTKGAMMCSKGGSAKGGMGMDHAHKGKKAGCCCDGMSSANMSRRT